MEWKERHENNVKESFESPVYDNSQELAQDIKRILIQNKNTWQRYGPESIEAQNNPLSNLHEVWSLRKLDTIVPNNRKIINIIKNNQSAIDIKDLDVCTNFIEHAEGFEMNCYSRTEGVPRFPKEFEDMVNHYAGI